MALIGLKTGILSSLSDERVSPRDIQMIELGTASYRTIFTHRERDLHSTHRLDIPSLRAIQIAGSVTTSIHP
jgi:hypothetical protein